MHIRTLLVPVALSLPLAALAEGNSPWLPIPDELAITLNQIEQSGDNAYIGATKLPLSAITGGGASKYQRSTTNLRVSYGLGDAVSLDATLGYGKVRIGAADNDKGRLDSVIGINWRVLDEFEQPGAPTLTLRGAAILRGNYNGGRLAGLGNDQNGVELAILIGKQLTSAFALWAELGVQDRSGSVPNATFYDIGARYRLAPQWSVNLGYSGKNYGGNIDIGGPGFTPSRFQDIRAERSLVKLGVGFALADNQGLALNLARVVRGRNSVKDDQVVGVAYTFAF